MPRKSSARKTTPRKRTTQARSDRAGRLMPAHRKAVIEIWKSAKDRKFYFHLRSSNGKIVVDNGQGYERRVDLVKTLKAVSAIFKEGRFRISEAA